MRIDERHTSELLGQSTRTMVLPSVMQAAAIWPMLCAAAPPTDTP